MADLIRPPQFDHRRSPGDDNTALPTLAALVEHPDLISTVPHTAIPLLLLQLNALQDTLTTRLLQQPAVTIKPATIHHREDDRLIDPEEAAQRLGVTVRWLYRHHKQLPFTRKLSRKSLKFSLAGLLRWLEKRRP